MEVIYAGEPIVLGENAKANGSIFLAGPTPRTKEVKSWRPEALAIFEEIKFEGTVFVPEPRDGSVWSDYTNQVEWEEAALTAADCILFWVPRKLPEMPAFTTNVEFGFWARSGKVVWGNPPGASHTNYPLYYCKKYGIPVAEDLRRTIWLALWRIHGLM